MAAGDTPPTHDLATTRDSVSAARGIASWRDENAHGLERAATGSWRDARDAFSRAIDALAGAPAPNVGTHEALALVLSNLAQACFRCGDIDDALRHAQRGCALRVALVGEDAVTVARARSDLAVMLAAAGRIEESPALLARAIAGIEQSAGDEDLRLAVVLENAARTALAAGQAANAEPHLIRLHALLGAHDLPTDAADQLVSRIMAARADSMSAGANQVAPDVEPDIAKETAKETAHEHAQDIERVAAQQSAHEVASEADVRHDAPLAVQGAAMHADEAAGALEADTFSASAPAPIAEDVTTTGDDSEWDDQPLRDAVALTDVLLRTTPTGNVAIRAESDARDPWTATPADGAASEPDIFGDSPLELVEIEAAHAHDADHGSDDRVHDRSDNRTDERAGGAPAPGGLGFVVEYGIPRDTASQPAVPDRSYEPPAIRGSDAIAREALDQASQFEPDGDQNVDLLTPPGASASLDIDPDFELVPDTQRRTDDAPAPSNASAPPEQIERRKTPRSVSVVMPSPAGGAPVLQSTMSDRDDEDVRGVRPPQPAGSAARPTVMSMDAVGAARPDGASGGASAGAPAQPAGNGGPGARPAPRVGTRIAKEPSGKGRGLAIGGGIAVLAAAAGWFFLSGSF